MLSTRRAKKNLGQPVIYTGGYPDKQSGRIALVSNRYIYIRFGDNLVAGCHPSNVILKNEWNKHKRWDLILND